MEISQLKEILEINISSPARRQHCWNTAILAKKLALRFNYPQWSERLYLAGLLHDIAKEWNDETIFTFYRSHHLSVTTLQNLPRKTWHAQVGRYYCQKKLKINDSRILDAIHFHTTAKKAFSDFGKILFIADKLEKDKKEFFFLQVKTDLFNPVFSLESLFSQTLQAVYQKLLTQNLTPVANTLAAYKFYCQN